jgi:uncharacterized protein YutE (UPF0331/DUF86 family)
MTSKQLHSKLDVLRRNLERLDAIPQTSFEEFSADFRNVAATLYLLQTAIQVLIDLAAWLVTQHALGTPRTSHEVFELLEGASLLAAGTAARVAPIVGFRNRVVHLYDRIDERRVYEVLTQHRSDLPQLLHQLLGALPDDEKSPRS